VKTLADVASFSKMMSTWLCEDAQLPLSHKHTKKNSRAGRVNATKAWHHVFTEDPAEIGRRLPRPAAPFPSVYESAPVHQLSRSDADSGEARYPEMMIALDRCRLVHLAEGICLM
jgi:hypothetical protein